VSVGEPLLLLVAGRWKRRCCLPCVWLSHLMPVLNPLGALQRRLGGSRRQHWAVRRHPRSRLCNPSDHTTQGLHNQLLWFDTEQPHTTRRRL
jgi:hypothetical protein